MHLRRLWSGPSQVFLPGGARVEMSTLLMLEAWAQLAGSEDAAVSVGAIRRFAAIQPSTATRLLDRAVEAGALIRVAGSGDARQRFVTATAAGRAMRQQAIELRTTWLRAFLGTWQQDDVRTFAVQLEHFAHYVHATGGPVTHQFTARTADRDDAPA